MYRHSPVRNQRSKGIKIKHVLQICLLVAVCFWLIFQLKRSHDKKKEFDASDTKISMSTHTQSSNDVIKFGRKDLQPKLEETTKEVEKHEEEQEQEEQEEHEEDKHEEEELDEDKSEEEKDDGGGGGDDEIDENEQEKSDMEIDREEVDMIDEDKETEESEEKENEEKDGQSQTENEVSLDDHDQEGATRNTREAREEHYKADDASSAVTHDSQTIGTENENGTLDNSSENAGLVDDGETAKERATSNITVIQEIGSESVGSSLNATTLTDSRENGPPSGTTVITSDSTQAQNVTEGVTLSGEQTSNSSIASLDANESVPSSTLTDETQNTKETLADETQNTKETEKSSNSTNISEVLKSNESTAVENSSGSSKTEVETHAGQGERSDTNNVMEGTEETLDSSETENSVEVQHDTIDSTDPSHLEEKEVRTDLDTLPEIETEGDNSEDTAAE